jgi:MraZ protein
MALFLSTFVNKVDRKGRVSVPASFRTTLGRAGAGGSPLGFVAYPDFGSDKSAALIASPTERMEKWAEELETVAPDSARALQIQLIFQEVREFTVDGDGRAILPADWLELLGVGEECAFVGQGREFLICHPDLPKRRLAQRRA